MVSWKGPSQKFNSNVCLHPMVHNISLVLPVINIAKKTKTKTKTAFHQRQWALLLGETKSHSREIHICHLYPGSTLRAQAFCHSRSSAVQVGTHSDRSILLYHKHTHSSSGWGAISQTQTHGALLQGMRGHPLSLLLLTYSTISFPFFFHTPPK